VYNIEYFLIAVVGKTTTDRTMPGPIPDTVTNRRQVLRTIGTALGGLAVTGTVGGAVEQATNSVTFEEQTTDGDSIVVAEVQTGVDSWISVIDVAENNTVFALMPLEAGTYEDYEIVLDETIRNSQTIQVWLFDGNPREDGTDVLDSDRAFVGISNDARTEQIQFVEADSEFGFNYPYYLFTPPVEREDEVPILVQPNNTGTSTDEFEDHRDAAKRTIGGGIGRRLSEKVGVPFLVPVFPRPQSDPVDWTHYVHQLDRETLSISDGDLERVDLQLLRMADHARKTVLSTADFSVSDELMLNGFSASGNFVDRFTVLHPGRVLSVTAGGVNGMALLPLEAADGQTLNYHIGIADVAELISRPVDLDALDSVNQFLYMGAEDTNDTIPYDDAWTDEELRETALDVYGEDMIADRFPRCQRAYQEAGVSAQFRIYDDTGHTPRPAEADLVEFHRRSIDDEDVSEFGDQLTVSASFELAPDAPAVDEQIEFDATESSGGRDEIVGYLWDFGDGVATTGETVTHSYEEPDEYTVTLTLITEGGTVTETTQTVRIGAASGTVTDAGDSETVTRSQNNETAAGDGLTNDDGPGFGLGSAFAAVVGVGYLLKRQIIE